MKFNIKNHDSTATISVHFEQSAGGMVLITSDQVGFSFVHTMTAEQASFMAAALVMVAEEADKAQEIKRLTGA